MEFFVRSNQADRPLKLNAEIKEGKSTCFVINPEPKPVIKDDGSKLSRRDDESKLLSEILRFNGPIFLSSWSSSVILVRSRRI